MTHYVYPVWAGWLFVSAPKGGYHNIRCAFLPGFLWDSDKKVTGSYNQVTLEDEEWE